MALSEQSLPGRFDAWRDSSCCLCGWIQRKIQHMTRTAAAAGREWHVLKRIMVIAGIKVTLLRVINERGQLRQSCSVKCESQWRKIPADLSGLAGLLSFLLISTNLIIRRASLFIMKCDTDEHEYMFETLKPTWHWKQTLFAFLNLFQGIQNVKFDLKRFRLPIASAFMKNSVYVIIIYPFVNHRQESCLIARLVWITKKEFSVSLMWFFPYLTITHLQCIYKIKHCEIKCGPCEMLRISVIVIMNNRHRI